METEALVKLGHMRSWEETELRFKPDCVTQARCGFSHHSRLQRLITGVQ